MLNNDCSTFCFFAFSLISWALYNYARYYLENILYNNKFNILN